MPHRRNSHIGRIYFFHYVFSYVSSKNHSRYSHIGCISVTSTVRFQMSPQIICMIERVHDRIGCICWSFSSVCSQMFLKIACLIHRMRCYNVCNWRTFPHCVPSYAASNSVYASETIHCHIGCICLTFPHCVLSCVSSNYLSDGINIYCDCIHLICCQHL